MNEEREKLVDPYAMTVANLRRRSNAVYLACEAPVAEDISKALRWAADEIERLSEAHAEIQRLQDAKRRALSLADERAKENVALILAAQAVVHDYPVAAGTATWDTEQGYGSIRDLRLALDTLSTALSPADVPDEGPDPLGGEI